jgi:hypothetical protein
MASYRSGTGRTQCTDKGFVAPGRLYRQVNCTFPKASLHLNDNIGATLNVPRVLPTFRSVSKLATSCLESSTNSVTDS